MQIKVTLNDFLYNAGLLGLIRLFQNQGMSIHEHMDGQTFTFQLADLEQIEKGYFRLLIDRYGYETNYTKMVESEEFVKFCLNEKISDKELDELNKLIEDAKRWLTSNSYKNTYHLITESEIDIEDLANSLKKVTKKKTETINDVKPQIHEMAMILLDCIEYLKNPTAKYYLCARILGYNIVQGFWKGISFLHKGNNTSDPYEEYNKYFVTPVKNHIASKNDAKKYAENKYCCATCENKMKNVSETFDLTWLQKIGIDSAKKSSYYWNHNRDIFICPVCNLIYSCIPLGFTLAKGKGIFVNNNQSVRQLVSSNELLIKEGDKQLTYDQLEEMTYYKIIDVIAQNADDKKELELDNIQIVKYDKQNESRPYTFNILSRQRAEVIVNSKNSLNYLVGKVAKENKEYIQIYQETVQRLYNGQTFSDLLFRLMKALGSGEFSNKVAIYHIIKVSNNQYKGVNKYMTTEELNKIRQYGYWLRNAYQGSENKLGGILHRLLNALKVKNENKFMETLIQAYSYKKEPIPSAFVQVFEDKDKFQTIGYTFLLGLQGYSGKEKEEK